MTRSKVPDILEKSRVKDDPRLPPLPGELTGKFLIRNAITPGTWLLVVAKTPEGVITWLSSNGLLDVDACRAYLAEHKGEDAP